jgi:riboflavin kinase/FMN adenylyltransferase
MYILSWDEFTNNKHSFPPSAMTIGVFDGVHRGHKTLIRAVVSRKAMYEPVVVTFKQNPKALLHPEEYCGDIVSLSQKLHYFEMYGIKTVILIDFSENFSTLTGTGFIDILIDQGNLRYLAVGSNFHCGYLLDTDATRVQHLANERGIVTDIFPFVTIGNGPVSSSRIRNAISTGNLVEATVLLGRNVELDLSDAPQTTENGKIVVYMGSTHQIIPPEGRYPIYVYEKNSFKGRVGEVVIKKETLELPGNTTIQRIEFLL